MPDRPKAEGGVWGSYVDYLAELEAEVERLRSIIVVTQRLARLGQQLEAHRELADDPEIKGHLDDLQDIVRRAKARR